MNETFPDTPEQLAYLAVRDLIATGLRRVDFATGSFKVTAYHVGTTIRCDIVPVLKAAVPTPQHLPMDKTGLCASAASAAQEELASFGRNEGLNPRGPTHF